MNFKWKMLGVLLVAAMLLSACSVMIPTRPVAEETAELANPVVELESSHALEEFGYQLTVPAQASDLVYAIVDDRIAQINFTYDGQDYCYRAAALNEQDIHGVHATFDKKENSFKLSDLVYSIDVQIQTISRGAEGAVASWKLNNTQFTLFTGSAVDLDAMAALVCQLADANHLFFQPEAKDMPPVDDSILVMQPILDSILINIGVDNKKWEPTDQDAYWAVLQTMASNYGLADDRVKMEDNHRLSVPRAAMLEWAGAITSNNNGLLELSPEEKSIIMYRPEFDSYYVAPSDRGDSETRIERVISRSWSDKVEVRLGYWIVGERVGSREFVLVLNPVQTEGNPYIYSVESVN